MSRIVSTMLSLLLCLWMVQAWAGEGQTEGDIKVHKEKIGEVQQEIERSQAQIESMRHKERLLLDRLDQMELHIQHLREQQEKTRKERANLRKQISQKRDELKELEDELGSLRTLLGERLAALYKFGRKAYVNVLTSAQDVRGLQHQWTYLRAIAEEDSIC